MTKKEDKINPTEIRLKEIEKELSELSSKKDELAAHWNLEKELIKTIRSSKEEIDTLKHEADKLEREGNLANVAELRYGKIPELEKTINDKTEELAKIQKNRKLFFNNQQIF